MCWPLSDARKDVEEGRSRKVEAARPKLVADGFSCIMYSTPPRSSTRSVAVQRPSRLFLAKDPRIHCHHGCSTSKFDSRPLLHSEWAIARPQDPHRGHLRDLWLSSWKSAAGHLSPSAPVERRPSSRHSINHPRHLHHHYLIVVINKSVSRAALLGHTLQ
jgi:hypothetical protein